MRSPTLTRSAVVLATAAIALATLSIAPRPAQADEEHKILLFDPDANHQDIVAITAWFNKYLDTADPSLKLQPVQSRETFEKLMQDPTSVFAIVSSAYLNEANKQKLTPLMVPQSNGDVYYRKVLLDRGVGPVGSLNHKTVAASAVAQNGAAALELALAQFRKVGMQVEGTRLLQVTKDIDALLALAFGQVDAAWVTENTIRLVKATNPMLMSSLRTLAETEKVLRSPLCVISERASADDKKRLLGALRGMSLDEFGGQAMHAMAFDQWVAIDPGMLKK